MRKCSSRILSLVLFLSIAVACSKSDPAPLGAQIKAKLLAGEANKSKVWKLRELSLKIGSGATQTQTLVGCFADNTYTFTNNAAQSYAANEGVSKCGTSTVDLIENGTWAFTLDGVSLIVGVDQTFSTNGVFSPEAIAYLDSNNQPNAYTIGYPYPAFVQTLTDGNMVLVMTNIVQSTTYTYTLTFTP